MLLRIKDKSYIETEMLSPNYIYIYFFHFLFEDGFLATCGVKRFFPRLRCVKVLHISHTGVAPLVCDCV